MPRTVESIVENHRAARARVAQGLSPWACTVFIRDRLNAEPPEGVVKGSSEHLAPLANEIGRALARHVPRAWRDVDSPEYSMDFEELVEWFDGITAEELREDEKIFKEDAVDLFDGKLDELYDWADRHRVWIG